MKKFLPFIIILFLASTIFAQTPVNYNDWCAYWLERVSTDIEDIRQPMEGEAYKLGAIAEKKEARDEILQNENAFALFSKLMGGWSPDTIETSVETRKIPAWLIRKVIERRKPLINSYGLDPNIPIQKKMADCFARGINSRYGYLEMVQIVVFQQLTVNEDLRFEEEAEELLHFLYKDVPPSEINSQKFAKNGRRNGYHGCWISSPLISVTLKNYLRLCRKSRK